MKKHFLLFIIVMLALSSNAFSQVKKDTFLCYIGKWQSTKVFKADSNYITGGAVGTTVTVNQDGSTYVQSQDGEKLDQTIDQGVGYIQPEEDNLKQQFQTSGSWSQYYLYTYSKEAEDSTKSFFESVKVPTSPPQHTQPPPSNFFSSVANACKTNWQDDYNAVMNFWQANKGDKNPAYPAPPQADYFNCWGSNRDQQKEFDKQCAGYDTTFFQPEADLERKALSLMRNLTLLGFGEDQVSNDAEMQQDVDNLFKHSRSNPANNGPCAYLDYSKLNQALAFLATRCILKAQHLCKDVKSQKNYNSTMPAIRVLLAATKQAILVLGSDAAGGGEDQALSQGSDLTYSLLNKMVSSLCTDHDYSYLTSIPFMLGLNRGYALLSGSQGESNSESFMNKIIGATHFTITVELQGTADYNGKGKVHAHLQGSAKMELELDSVYGTRFVLNRAENSVITLNVLENTMTIPQCSPTYVGTKTFGSSFPYVSLHFCGTGIDSLTLATFHPTGGTALWQFPCTPQPSDLGINGLDGYFIDPNSIVKQAQAIKANQSQIVGNLQSQLAMLKQMQSSMGNMTAASGQNNPAAGAQIANVVNMGNANVTNSPMATMSHIILPVTVTNKSVTLINQTFDAKKINTETKMTQLLDYDLLLVTFKSTPGSGN